MRELDGEMRTARLGAAQLDAGTLAALLAVQFSAWRRDRELNHPLAEDRIVLLEGRPAGFVSTERAESTVHIVDLLVRGDLRGRGVGSAVLRLLFADADAGARAVTGRVEADNQAALRFYVRAGFQVTARDSLEVTIERLPGRPEPGIDRAGDPPPRR